MPEVRQDEPSERLLTLEREIHEGLEEFVRVGLALRTIRNERLYEERGCATFEAYVTKVWDPRLGQRYAAQLIEAARAHEVLGAIAPKQPELLPQTEGAMRPFTALLPRDPEYAEGRERGWRPDSEEYLRRAGQRVQADRRVAQHRKPPPATVVKEHVMNELLQLEETGVKPTPEAVERPRSEVIERIRAAAVTVTSGDLYAVGPHRLICGDATEMAVYRRLLGEVRPRLLFTDPPYNQNYGGGLGARPFAPIPNDHLSPDEASLFLTQSIMHARVHLADDAAAYICAPSMRGDLLEMFIETVRSSEAAWEVSGLPGPRGWDEMVVIFWDKGSIGPGSPDGYRGQHEAILHMRGSSEWYGGSAQEDVSTVWDVARPPKPYVHPNEKPFELAQRAMLNSTPTGAATPILDPFVGSGSTVIAAHLLAKKHDWPESPVYGIDVDPGNMERALLWIEHHTGYRRELLEPAPEEDDDARAFREALEVWEAEQREILAAIPERAEKALRLLDEEDEREREDRPDRI